jgi:hypothetical protein
MSLARVASEETDNHSVKSEDTDKAEPLDHLAALLSEPSPNDSDIEGHPGNVETSLRQGEGQRSKDMFSEVVGNKARAWCVPLIELVQKAKAAIGEYRPLRIWSSCTGLWSEGKAFEARPLRSSSSPSRLPVVKFELDFRFSGSLFHDTRI